MAGYNEFVSRDDNDHLVPEQVATEVLQELPQQSVLLQRARRATMSSRTFRQPVLSALPDAYWVSGDTGLKETTKADWDAVELVAEELAAIVVIPDNLVADSSVPLWNEIRPLMTEAIGRKVDQAGLFGTDKPSTWPTAVVPGAIGAGNVVQAGTHADLAADVASLGNMLSSDGFAVNGFASQPGFTWTLVGMRTTQGVPIYQPNMQGQQGGTLYGYPLGEVTNGSWDSGAAQLLAADWNKLIVGVRQDITYTMLREAAITDENGRVIMNLAQQDAQALRVVFRVGFQVANPMTRASQDEASRYPAGVLAPAAPEGG